MQGCIRPERVHDLPARETLNTFRARMIQDSAEMGKAGLAVIREKSHRLFWSPEFY